MSTATKLSLLAQTKEAQRIKLGVPANMPWSEYVNYIISTYFDPLTIFAGGKQGAWYDPSDLSTLFKDAAGSQPVTADGDPVGLMRDKSGNGNHATQTVSAARPIYKTNGVLHWLQFDGVDDDLSAPFSLTKEILYAAGVSSTTPSQFNCIVSVGGGGTSGAGLELLTSGLVTDVFGNAGVSVNKTLTAGNHYSVLFQTPDWSVHPSNSQFFVNTADVLSTVSYGDVSKLNNSSKNPLRIGSFARYSTSFFRGKMYSVIASNSVISQAQVELLLTYINAKSGVTL